MQTLPEVVSEAGYAVAGVAGVGVDEGHDGQDPSELGGRLGVLDLCCQMAKFDPFLSLDCARVEGVGAQSKERKGSNFAA